VKGPVPSCNRGEHHSYQAAFKLLYLICIGTQIEAPMSIQPPNAKPPAAAQSSLPASWVEAIGGSDGTNWLDTFPVGQPGKTKPGLQGQLLLVAEVAAILRRSSATVRKYLRQGVLTGQRHFDEWRVSEADLNTFLIGKAVGVSAPKPVSGDAACLIPPCPANDPTAAVNDAAAPPPILRQQTKVTPGQALI
jgi:hypothetical protein